MCVCVLCNCISLLLLLLFLFLSCSFACACARAAPGFRSTAVLVMGFHTKGPQAVQRLTMMPTLSVDRGCAFAWLKLMATDVVLINIPSPIGTFILLACTLLREFRIVRRTLVSSSLVSIRLDHDNLLS